MILENSKNPKAQEKRLVKLDVNKYDVFIVKRPKGLGKSRYAPE